MEENFSKNAQIKKEVWEKDISIFIPDGRKIKSIDEVQIFILKLIFYLDYISITNLKTILNPVVNERKADALIKELVDSDLLKLKKKGYYGTFYYLSKYCLRLLTGEKAEGEYPLKNISNPTLESQDYRHRYLAQLIIKTVLIRLEKVFSNMSPDAKEGFLTHLFVENISFDLMRKLPDTESHLSGLGYEINDIKRVIELKSYGKSEREKYRERVLAHKADILGYDRYFSQYKMMIAKEQHIFARYNILYDLISLDKDFDYFDCIKKTIKETGSNVSGHNLIKYQTGEVRQKIAGLLQYAMRENGLEPSIAETLKIDKGIQDYQDRIYLYNAICINLKKNQNNHIKNGEICEDEIPFYNQAIKSLKKYMRLKEKTQEEYNGYKKAALFTDSQADINEEDRPVIYLRGLEFRNVFIGNVELKTDKKKQVYLKISIVKIDRNKEQKNFKASNLRRDYYGVCEMLKAIENETGIKIDIEYTYCYPEGSNITNYKIKLDRIFKNTSSNSNMVGADKFMIEELKSYVPYDEYMKKINGRFII